MDGKEKKMYKFTFEEKLEAVQRVISGEMGSLRSVRILGVNYSSIDTWVRLVRETPYSLHSAACVFLPF